MNDTLLGPLERRVMTVLWDSGTSTAREVLDAVNRGSGNRDLAYTTVNTILARLHEKGYARREARGRQFVYTAAHSRDDFPDAVGRRDLERLIARYGAPAVARFAADLAEAQPDVIDGLRELAGKRSGNA